MDHFGNDDRICHEWAYRKPFRRSFSQAAAGLQPNGSILMTFVANEIGLSANQM